MKETPKGKILLQKLKSIDANDITTPRNYKLEDVEYAVRTYMNECIQKNQTYARYILLGDYGYPKKLGQMIVEVLTKMGYESEFGRTNVGCHSEWAVEITRNKPQNKNKKIYYSEIEWDAIYASCNKENKLNPHFCNYEYREIDVIEKPKSYYRDEINSWTKERYSFKLVNKTDINNLFIVNYAAARIRTKFEMFTLEPLSEKDFIAIIIDYIKLSL